MNPEERDPFKFFMDDNVPKKPEQPVSDNVVDNLRSDLLASSEVEPESKTIVQQVNWKLAGGIIIGLIMVWIILFALVGAGRSKLERSLADLKSAVPTNTEFVKASEIAATVTPKATTIPPTKTSTLRPTSTKASPSSTPIIMVTTPTEVPATQIPTSNSGCRDVSTITLADVGQTLCVQGTIIETISNPSNFMVIFNTEKGTFYWVTYDLVWSQAELDTCYKTTGKIDQIANSPILVFGYYNLPQACP